MAEDITFQFPQLFPEIMDANIFTATVDAIDYENDTADITIAEIGSFSDVEIFYHCQHCSNSNEGSLAFNVGDSVRVLNPKGSCSPSATAPFSKMRIIGFSDGAKRYCKVEFVLTLSRAGGTQIDNDLYSSYCTIEFYDSDNVKQTGVTKVYDEFSLQHTFSFVPTTLASGGAATEFYIKGVYAEYSTTFIWFPDKYKTIYLTNPPVSCLRTPGSYTFEFPYWRNVPQGGGNFEDRGDKKWYRLTTYSSIPYKVTHKATAPANWVSHIVYLWARTVSGLTEGGERCCQLGWTSIADVNGPDPNIRQPGAEGYGSGGFGHSYITLDITSDLLSYTEGYQRTEALDLEEIEDCAADIGGVTRNIYIINNTPVDADWRYWECSGDCPGPSTWIEWWDTRSALGDIRLIPSYDI